MTDYTSQGKTRPKNPVYLSNCRSHQSYYTCLSRRATADGTVIVQSFSPQLITCGASGYLRPEFRELELLNEISKLRYEGQLQNFFYLVVPRLGFGCAVGNSSGQWGVMEVGSRVG